MIALSRIYSTGPIQNRYKPSADSILINMVNNNLYKSTEVTVFVFALEGDKRILFSHCFILPPNFSTEVEFSGGLTGVSAYEIQIEATNASNNTVLLSVNGVTCSTQILDYQRFLHSELIPIPYLSLAKQDVKKKHVTKRRMRLHSKA
ncbi:hypothetical protein ACERII_20145 [Evansella sp. AB-rgal1]|uniref:hypothetical protein n=1 Tax=Evansella sp. AB-rgal1 TaxID=3242696 RepID=UPI00359F06AC